jgi:hypothetical protein
MVNVFHKAGKKCKCFSVQAQTAFSRAFLVLGDYPGKFLSARDLSSIGKLMTRDKDSVTKRFLAVNSSALVLQSIFSLSLLGMLRAPLC